MADFVRIGKTILNLDRVRTADGLEKTVTFTITGPAAERLRAYFEALARDWNPVVEPADHFRESTKVID